MTEESLAFQTKLSDSQISEWFGDDAFFEWFSAPEDEQIRFFLKKGAVACGSYSETDIKKMSSNFVQILTNRNIPFTVVDRKNELPNGMFFRRTIRMNLENSTDQVQ